MIVILIIDERPLPPTMPEIAVAFAEIKHPEIPKIFEREAPHIPPAKPARPKSHQMKTRPRRVYRKQTR